MGHSADRALVKCHYVQHRSPTTILERASGAEGTCGLWAEYGLFLFITIIITHHLPLHHHHHHHQVNGSEGQGKGVWAAVLIHSDISRLWFPQYKLTAPQENTLANTNSNTKYSYQIQIQGYTSQLLRGVPKKHWLNFLSHNIKRQVVQSRKILED